MRSRPLRSVLATIAGILAAIVTVMIVEAAGHLAFPPPTGLDITDPADQARLMEAIPLGARIMVAIAWLIGSIIGPWVAMRLSASALAGYAVAALMIAAALWTTQSFPHPAWMVIAAIVLPAIGALIARRLQMRAIAR